MSAPASPRAADGAAARVPVSVLVCAGCGASPAPGQPYPFRCPNAGSGDVDHVLRRRLDLSAVAAARIFRAVERTGKGGAGTASGPASEPSADGERIANPYLRFRRLFHSYHVARTGGMTDEAYVELVARLDAAVARVDGHGFVATPFGRADALSDRLGFGADGGVWVKNETGNVSGSHKARHLFDLLVWLEVVEHLNLADRDDRRPLAIASCGNAALAAAVVAAAGGRRLDVFVPVGADPVVVDRLRDLGARIDVIPRQPGVPGDPTYHRLRAAIAEGALPFTCQGNENGLAVEGGFTLGYEMADALAGERLDRLVVQVGGGALASACIESLGECAALGAIPSMPRVHAVQTEAAWPLRRAYDRVAGRVTVGADRDEVDAALSYAATHRAEFMWPWETEPHSVAHGILDDETYDWLAIVEGMLRTGGTPVVVGEEMLVRANRLAVEATGIDADETGSSGLAGLVALRERGEVGDHERVAVLFTGIRR